jgi:6-pyruvoyl-tetrahydropterin synthase
MGTESKHCVAHEDMALDMRELKVLVKGLMDRMDKQLTIMDKLNDKMDTRVSWSVFTWVVVITSGILIYAFNDIVIIKEKQSNLNMTVASMQARLDEKRFILRGKDDK